MAVWADGWIDERKDISRNQRDNRKKDPGIRAAIMGVYRTPFAPGRNQSQNAIVLKMKSGKKKIKKESKKGKERERDF